MNLAVPPRPALLDAPPLPETLPALTVTSFTLTPVFLLVTFNVFLGSFVFVPVPMSVVCIPEAFMVGTAVIISKRCL